MCKCLSPAYSLLSPRGSFITQKLFVSARASIARMKPDSPAIHSRSLKIGQCVVEIDGSPLLNIRNARDLAELTQGKPGSTATLLVIGEDGGEEHVVLQR